MPLLAGPNPSDPWLEWQAEDPHSGLTVPRNVIPSQWCSTTESPDERGDVVQERWGLSHALTAHGIGEIYLICSCFPLALEEHNVDEISSIPTAAVRGGGIEDE